MKVLLAVDITDPICEQVVAKALPWVTRMGATVDLAYIIEYADVHPYVLDPKLRELISREWERIETKEVEKLKDLMSVFPAELRGEMRQARGRTTGALVDMSKDYEAVMIGTHGRSGLGRFWMGSVAETVTRRATVPVFVLKLDPELAE